ncbi:hypothetical protein ACLOJK_037017 [Asimina triloba]
MAHLKPLDPAIDHHKDDTERFLQRPISPSKSSKQHVFRRWLASIVVRLIQANYRLRLFSPAADRPTHSLSSRAVDIHEDDDEAIVPCRKNRQRRPPASPGRRHRHHR